MDRVIDDLLKEGIANTEGEIFNEAVGKDAPSTEGGPGDRSPEEMGTGHEGQLEPEETEAGAEDQGEGEAQVGEGEGEGQGEQKPEGGEQPRDPKTGQYAEKPAEGAKPAEPPVDDRPVDPKARVPLSELISERKARQELQRQLETERSTSKSQFDQLSARIDQLSANQKPAQPQPQQPPKKEFWDDPDAYVANIRTDLQTDIRRQFVNADLQRTHKQEGERFLRAYNELTERGKTDPVVAAEMLRINQSGTPGMDIMEWHVKQEASREIGGDPAAYRARVEAEAREKLAKDPEFLKSLGVAAPAGGQQAPTGTSPRHVTRLPKSLNGASGGQSGARADTGNQVTDGSDRGVFDAAFTD